MQRNANGVTEMTAQKTYANGATVKMIILQDDECISNRVVVFNVYDKNGIFACQLDDQFDACQLAQSL